MYKVLTIIIISFIVLVLAATTAMAVSEPPCLPCENGALEVSYRSSSGDIDERIRVRIDDLNGEVLFDSYSDDNPSPGIAVGGAFSFSIPGTVTQIVVTVQGDSHPNEYVKGTLLTDCSLAVGDSSGNSYIGFEVTVVELIECSPLAVVFGYIEVEKVASGVRISWSTLASAASAGFNIYDSYDTKLNTELIPPQASWSWEDAEYEYYTRSLHTEFYVEEIGFGGNRNKVGPIKVGERVGLPKEFKLMLPLIAGS